MDAETTAVSARAPAARERLRAWREQRRATLKATGLAIGRSASLVCEIEKGTRGLTFEIALAYERASHGELTVEDLGFDRATARRLADLQATGTEG